MCRYMYMYNAVQVLLPCVTPSFFMYMYLIVNVWLCPHIHLLAFEFFASNRWKLLFSKEWMLSCGPSWTCCGRWRTSTSPLRSSSLSCTPFNRYSVYSVECGHMLCVWCRVWTPTNLPRLSFTLCTVTPTSTHVTFNLQHVQRASMYIYTCTCKCV